MLYGDSGTGKSSLINAGLLAAARRKGFQPERIRVQPVADQELVIERITADDQNEHVLPSIFRPVDGADPHIVLSVAEFEKRLRTARGSARPLLVFDQFEELVTLFEESEERNLQRAIVQLLVSIFQNDVLPVKVLLSFREDYLARIKQLLEAAPELVDQALRLTPPRADELTTIIRGPFDRHPGAFGRVLSPELAQTLSEKLADRFGSGDVSLSEVQTVCLRLWQADDPEALLAARGIQGLLEDYLGEELEAYPPELKYAAITLLSQMVTSAGTRNVISAESLIGSVREEEQKIAPELLEQALQRLESESKLVRRERRRDLYLYEITSEFLVPWISGRREELIRLQERRRERLRRRAYVVRSALVVLLVVVAGVVGLAGWAIHERSIAVRREHAVFAYATKLRKASGKLTTARREAQKASQLAAVAAKRTRARLAEAARAGKRAGSEQAAAAAAEARRRAETAAARQTHRVVVQADRRATLAAETATQQQAAAIAAKNRAAYANQLAKAQQLANRAAAELAVDPESALRTATAAMEAKPTRQAESALRQAISASYSRVVLTGHRDGVTRAAFSPDGKLVVTASWDKTAKIWDARTGKLLRTLKGFTHLVDAEFSPDGKQIVTVGAYDDWTAHIWNAATGKLVRVLRGGGGIWTAHYSRDGKFIVTASEDRTARIWDARTGELAAGPFEHPTPVMSAALSPDDKLLVTGDDSGIVRIWDVATHSVLREVTADAASVNSVAFSPGGGLIVSAGEDKTAWVWDTGTGQVVEPLVGHAGAIHTAFFDRTGQLIVTGSSDGTARVWDVDSATTLTILRGHTNGINSAAFSPDGKSIVTASWDKTARLWSAPQFHSLLVPPTQRGPTRTYSVAFSPDGRWVLTADADSASVWDVRRHRFGPALRDCFGVTGAAFSHDGKLIVAGCGLDRAVKVWASRSGKVIRTLAANSTVDSVAFSPNGKLVAAGEDRLSNRDEEGLVWDWRSGKVRWRLRHHKDAVASLAFSRNGKLLVSAGFDAQPIVWDVRTGKQVGKRLSGHTGGTNSASFSRDGRLVVTTSNDATARIWSVRTDKTVTILRGHTGPTTSAAFSPNGKVIVTVSEDGTARLWDALSGGQLAVLPGRMGPVQSVAFSPDGKSFVIGGGGTARIYPCGVRVCGSRSQLLALAHRELAHLARLAKP